MSRLWRRDAARGSQSRAARGRVHCNTNGSQFDLPATGATDNDQQRSRRRLPTACSKLPTTRYGEECCHGEGLCGRRRGAARVLHLSRGI